MLPLEEQVSSLKLSQRLKELGVPQDSHFYWCKFVDREWHLGDENLREGFGIETDVSAFTVAELGEMLPDLYTTYHATETVRGKIKRQFECCPNGYDLDKGVPFFYDEFEANARAKMLIYLLENKEDHNVPIMKEERGEL